MKNAVKVNDNDAVKRIIFKAGGIFARAWHFKRWEGRSSEVVAHKS